MSTRSSLEALGPWLRCPETRATGFRLGERTAVCTGSGRVYARRPAGWWDFGPWLGEREDLTTRVLGMPGVRGARERHLRPALRRLVSRQSEADGTELALRMLRLGPGQRLLDIGCGSGVFARTAAERIGASEGAWVVGLDRSAAVLDAATELPRWPSSAPLHWMRGEARSVPFVNGTFDAVFCGAALARMERPEVSLRELARVIRPGGRLVLSTVVGSAKRLPHRLRRVAARAVGVEFFAPEDLPRMLEGLGLRATEEVIEGGVIHLAAEVVGELGSG